MAYRRTAKIQSRLDAARERIVDATFELVAREGWSRATVAMVAEQAGVATGTVYRHFDGKDQLFGEVFRRAAGRELSRVSQAAQGDGAPLDRLAAALRTFAERAMQARRLAYALLAEPAGAAVEAERLTYRSGYHQVFRDLLEEAVTVGDLDVHDEALVAAVLTGAMGEALVGPLSPVVTDDDRSEDATSVDAVVAACLRALPPRPSPQRRESS